MRRSGVIISHERSLFPGIVLVYTPETILLFVSLNHRVNILSHIVSFKGFRKVCKEPCYWIVLLDSIIPDFDFKSGAQHPLMVMAE